MHFQIRVNLHNIPASIKENCEHNYNYSRTKYTFIKNDFHLIWLIEQFSDSLLCSSIKSLICLKKIWK